MANDKLRTFYMILLNSEESIPVSYFTEKLSISAKTAYNYLKELDFELKQYDLQLVKQKQQGYLLEGSDEEKRRFRSYLDQDYLNQDYTEARRQELLENLLMRDRSASFSKSISSAMTLSMASSLPSASASNALAWSSVLG